LINKIIKEPLVHFLLLGWLIFVVYQWRQGPEMGDTVEVSAQTVATLANQYRKTWMREPTRQELQQAVDHFVANQLFAERAFALGMHHDDPVVARRMRMKMELLNELAVMPPSEGEVAEYFDANSEKYSKGATYSFEHRFFADDTSDAILSAAGAALNRGDEVAGSPSLFAQTYDNAADIQVARVFGSEFVEQLQALTPGEWQGPLPSPLGWHFVRLSERRQLPPPSLLDIYDQVVRDVLNERREQARQEQLQALMDEKAINVNWPEDMK
jgi:parvulin-like peptidyl-prolyl isomerase